MLKEYIFKWRRTILLFILPMLLILCFSAYGNKIYQLHNLVDNQVTSTIANSTIKNNSNSTIRIKGKPFFPFGFYHESYNLTFQQLIQAVRDLAAAGFNTIFASCDNLDNYGVFLDEAERVGVFVITSFNVDDPLAVVKKFKDKPAVLGWGIADDVGDHETRNEILAFHKQIKAIDPKHFTYISISGWSRKWLGHSNIADLIGGQSYPISYPFNNKPKGLANDLSTVHHVFNIGRFEANKYNRPVIANLQTFRWEEGRWPTANEVYNMTYQALLAGVKGILFYTYEGYKDNSIRQKPDVWSRVKSIVPEINRLTPVLLEGTLTKLDTKFDDVLAGQWIYGNSVYLVVLNTSQTETRQVVITIPTPAKGSAQPLFSGRPSGMRFQDGKLRGFIKPEDVHIYQLSQSRVLSTTKE
ncbi:hypothetical protein [Nostoc sp. MG11]|uniref:hypothetical protein n=1 Tax=Nostoc sp. MG11 TaxID=2721166 RepID=UPI001866D1BE|nr:hypothetical protein [Nostoc sp. MG11]